jgi:hypothetical protein
MSMPDFAGKLTPEEIAKAAFAISNKAGGELRCTVCKSPEWNVEEYVLAPPTFGSSYNIQFLGGPGIAFPQVALMCSNCGHTMLFNAVHLGLYPAVEGGNGQGSE